MTTDKDQTMAAKLKAHNNTDYTTAQVRNIILSPDILTVEGWLPCEEVKPDYDEATQYL